MKTNIFLSTVIITILILMMGLKTYSQSRISKEDYVTLIRGELASKIKVKNGTNKCAVRLLENFTIDGVTFQPGDLLNGVSRVERGRVEIYLTKIVKSNTGAEYFIDAEVFDYDLCSGLCINGSERDVAKDVIDGVSNAVSWTKAYKWSNIINSVDKGSRKKFEEGYFLRIYIN